MMKKNFIGLNFGIIAFVFSLFFIGFTEKAEASRPKHPLVGVWTMEYKNGNKVVECYKIFKRDGEYINLRSLGWGNGQFDVTHWGKYTIGSNEYIEHLLEERGSKCWPPVNIVLKYEFLDPNTIRLNFRLGRQNYTETWHRAKKAPKYDKRRYHSNIVVL